MILAAHLKLSEEEIEKARVVNTRLQTDMRTRLRSTIGRALLDFEEAEEASRHLLAQVCQAAVDKPKVL
jgi:hypothetical protein